MLSSWDRKKRSGALDIMLFNGGLPIVTPIAILPGHTTAIDSRKAESFNKAAAL
jgi:hypothetical protein